MWGTLYRVVLNGFIDILVISTSFLFSSKPTLYIISNGSFETVPSTFCFLTEVMDTDFFPSSIKHWEIDKIIQLTTLWFRINNIQSMIRNCYYTPPSKSYHIHSLISRIQLPSPNYSLYIISQVFFNIFLITNYAI